jgi:hypothetical protein
MPMEDFADQARQWRERAKEVRLLARRMTHPTAKNDLHAVAEQWDSMAMTAEFRATLMRRVESKRQISAAD